jgi:predicted nucleic acid-binding protein
VQARDDGLLRIVDEGDTTAYPQLDEGESTVLSAAQVAKAAVLIDERKARNLIQSDPHLQHDLAWVSGLLGLLLVAKRRQRVDNVRPPLDQLTAQRFRISPELRVHVFHHPGELPHED